MKKSISNYVYIRYGENRFKYMKEDGFDACDFGLSETESEFYKNPKLLLEEKRLADEAGVEIFQVHGPWRYPPQDTTEQERAERFEKMRLCLEMTKMLGCKYMVIHPIMPFGPDDDGDYDVFFKMNVEFFKKLIPHAKENGVIICLENMPMKKLTIAPPKDTADLIYALDSEWVKMCLDTGHSIIREVQPADALRKYSELITTLHLHDNKGNRDWHYYPFDERGIIDWADFSKALKEVSFKGTLDLEVVPDGELDDVAHRQECKKLFDILNKIENPA